MAKTKSDYSMIQIDREVYQQMKEYCKENGYSLKGLIQLLIKREIKK